MPIEHNRCAGRPNCRLGDVGGGVERASWAFARQSEDEAEALTLECELTAARLLPPGQDLTDRALKRGVRQEISAPRWDQGKAEYGPIGVARSKERHWCDTEMGLAKRGPVGRMAGDHGRDRTAQT